MRPVDPLPQSPVPAPEGVLDGIIGSYRCQQVLGRGGMGTVYLAEHVRTGRSAAIKLIRPEHRDRPEAAQRLLTEARALGRVSHPGIVAVLDHDIHSDGTTYLVMEYLPGTSLRTRLRAQTEPLLLDVSLGILHQIALALAAAHQAGIVHRDLTPANLMLRGRAWESFPRIEA